MGNASDSTTHGIDCLCDNCYKIREILFSKNVFLVATPEDMLKMKNAQRKLQ